MRRTALVVAVLAVVVGGLVGYRLWTGAEPGPGTSRNPPTPPGAPVDADLETARSEPVEDSYYSRVGDPGVDSLHYGLDLTWDPQGRELTGAATLTFRATADASSVQLDLGDPLEVTRVRVDGLDVDYEHTGKDLVLLVGVRADREYTAVIDYEGTPEPVPAPATRPDLPSLGWTITDTGAVWTMQEPFGAFTWYPVNDQPSDKAYYDVTVRVPAPWVGVSNGTLLSRRTRGDLTVTRFRLDRPASSYLITIGIGDYASRTARSESGVPLTYWVPRPAGRAFHRLSYAAEALDWIERRLGPYPFASAGVLLVDSDSAMETQTLLTLGNRAYSTSRRVLVHELVHQWYGDLVTPRDWRDVWMNEGMTYYLQVVYESESGGPSLEDHMRELAAADQMLRDQAGPPGRYFLTEFGSGNIYYCPALMWHQLRGALGEAEFWRLVRAWPRVHADGNADRDDWFTWIEQQTGRDLDDFFTAWIDGTTTPGDDLLDS